MNTVKIDLAKLTKAPNPCDCEINCLHIQINDFAAIVDEFEQYIIDRTWLNKLAALPKISLTANSKKTVEKIVNEIIAKVKGKVNEDIGEFIVSYCAQHALHVEYSHEKIPLAELLKEKVSGNPGFDYHTISTKHNIIFGEAKFSVDDTPRANALEQIASFIGDRDDGELMWLDPFLTDKSRDNIAAGHKGYAAAFSYNNKDILRSLNNALESDPIAEIIKHKELYIIAVEIC